MRRRFQHLRLQTKIVFILISSLAVGFGVLSCANQGYSGTIQQLTIGSTHNEADTLIYVAYEQGFFNANGVNAVIKDYSSGSAAVDGMLKGEVDIATSSEFVIVQNAFKQQKIYTVGALSKNYTTFLIARTDRGIRNISDLEGKKVGIPGQTLAQFQLGRFLDLNGMTMKQITIVNIDVARSVDIIVNGDVDAVQTWEPYVSSIKTNLGDKIVVWPAQSAQPQYKNLTATNTWLAQHPDLVKRVLKALAQADSFIAVQPDQAKTIIKKRLQYSDEYIASAWPLNQFSLSLDQSLITAMEDEARWMIKNNLTTEKTVPDFGNYIYIDGLKAVKPEAVNIIR